MRERTSAIALALTLAAPILLSTGARAQSSASRTVDVSTYSADLVVLADRIRQADARSAADLQQSIPAVWRIEEGGRTIEVDTGWLHQQLRTVAAAPERWPATRTEILESLATARREAELLEEPPAASSLPDARASIEQVLARPEFAQIARDSAIERMWRRVGEWLRRWWSRLGGDRLPVRSTATVFAWIATLAALVVLVVWLVHTLRRASRVAQAIPDASSKSRMSAQAWARRAIETTDLREAARYAWRAIVCRLEEEGTWRVDEARTPREYLRLLPAEHRRRPVAEDLTRRFEEIWFAGRAASDQDRGAIVSRLKEIGCLPAE